jgi:hypothetical protein
MDKTIWVVWVVVVCFIGPVRPTFPQEVEPSTLICGPLCVKYILNTVGKDEDINVLARACLESDAIGCSIDGLVSMLRERGIDAKAFETSNLWACHFTSPAILYIPREQTIDKVIGHFVVIENKSENGALSLWFPDRTDFSASHYARVVSQLRHALVISTDHGAMSLGSDVSAITRGTLIILLLMQCVSILVLLWKGRQNEVRIIA